MFGKRKEHSLYPIQGKPMIELDSSNLTPTETNLTQVKDGTLAKVIALQGGQKFAAKLDAMKIVPGTVILKKTSALKQGPIVIEKDNMQLAIGYGMAKKIIVEPIEPVQ